MDVLEPAVLFAAAKGGDAATVERLLKAGMNPDAADDSGRTALHHSVAAGHVDAVACLLAYGAAHGAVDREGNAAIEPERMAPEALHSIRQRYQRFRLHDDSTWRPPSEAIRSATEELSRRGIVRLPAFVGGDALARLKTDFEVFVAELDSKLARGEGHKIHYDEELHWWPNDHAYISNNAFKSSSDLIRLCFDPRLLAIVDGYLRKPAFVSRGVAARYLPAESTGLSAFRWHHDMEERRLKALLLLTDIHDTDQYMSYVAGSHDLYHPYEMFFRNKCPLEYCEERLGAVDVVNTVGRAGDVFFFDSNGAHQGIRRPDGRVRDACFIEFACNNAQVWGGDIDRALVEQLSADGVNPFERMLTAEKKWSLPRTRTAPAWVDTLPRLAAWL